MAEVRQINIVGIDYNVAGAPEIFVDGFGGIVVKDHVVKFNLFADVLLSPAEQENPLTRVVKARLVMSDKTFYEFAKLLASAADDFEKTAQQHELAAREVEK
jgi:hypothetical protein